MKAFKLIVAFALALSIGLITAAEVNMENAVRAASQKESLEEMEQVLHEHGFRIGIHDEVTPAEKIKALFR